MSENENERLIRLETKFEMLTETLTNAIIRLEKKLDYREESYVTKEVLEIKLEQRDRRIEQLEVDKKDNKHLKPLWAAFAISIVAVIVAIIPLFIH